MWIFFNIFFILTSIAILPIPNIRDTFWVPKELIFNLLGISFIASTWFGSNIKRETFKNKWFALILICCAISFSWYFYTPLAITYNKKILWNLWVIRPFINTFLGLLIIQTLVEYTDSLHRWVSMAKTLCWVAFGFSIYTIMQNIGIDPIFNNVIVSFEGESKGITLLGNANLTANFIAILSPLCLIFKDLRYKIIYFLCFIGILFTGSALSLVAFVLGLFIYLLFNRKWKLTLLLIISGILLIVIKKPHFFNFTQRFDIWKYTFEHCKDTLWLGKGIGNFAFNQYKPVLTNEIAISAHCEPLQILHDGGILVFSLISIYILNLFWRIFLSKWNMLLIGFISAFFAYLTICLGNFPLRIAPLALTGIIYIAAIEAILLKGEHNG